MAIFRNLNVTYLFIVALVWFVRLFLIENGYSDDPTSELWLKHLPSWQSCTLDRAGLTGHTMIAQDEMGFFGVDLFRAIVSWGWFVVPLSVLGMNAYLVYTRRTRKSKRNRMDSGKTDSPVKSIWVSAALLFSMVITFWVLMHFQLDWILCWIWTLLPLLAMVWDLARVYQV